MDPVPEPHRHRTAPVVFLADLHLDASAPEALERFRAFTGRATRASAVYILGDLFEVWIGDDDDSALARATADALARLSAAGVPTWFMAGNRDFLVGERFLARAGIDWLDDPAVIDLFGVRTLLCHGDTLCTDDHAYQAFRARVRDPAWQAEFLARPLAERRHIAEGLRADSQDAMSGKAATAMDVPATAVEAAAREHGAERIIHGHTHQPARHEHTVDGRRVERWVLADWYTAPGILVADDGGVHACEPEAL